MAKNLSLLINKNALKLYVALILLILAAFGVSPEKFCKVMSMVGMTHEQCEKPAEVPVANPQPAAQ